MRNLIILAALVVVAPSCGAAEPVSAGSGPDRDERLASSALPDPPTSTVSRSPVSTGSAVSRLPPRTGSGAPQPAEVATATESDEAASSEPVFEWSVEVVDESNRAEVASTWRPECPVALEDLRILELSHRDYEGGVQTGRLVIRHDLVDAVVSVFGRLFEAGFPVERMEPVDVYGGDDQASMAANNTSAFNCREISGSPGVWSQHAYAGAIDVNPLVNPWVQGSRVDPPEGEPFADRDLDVPGLIRAGDAVTEAFAEVGWGWGGDWVNSKDYQHFSWNGR